MKNISIIICFIIAVALANAQENDSRNLQILVEGGILAGAEVNQNTGNFKRAPTLRAGLLYPVHKHISVGGGVGIEWYDEETLFPIYADLRLYKKSEGRTPFFATHAGYAPGWHEAYRKLDNYELEGGWRLGFDYGWHLAVQDQLAVQLSLGLHFQQLRIDVDTGFSDDYTESITYVLLGFKTGILF